MMGPDLLSFNQIVLLGFNRVVMNKLITGLDMFDLHLLEGFIELSTHKSSIEKEFNNIKYIQVDYQIMADLFPIFKVKKRTVMDRFIQLTNLKLFHHYTYKDVGTFSYYAINQCVFDLILSKNNKSDSDIISNLIKLNGILYDNKDICFILESLVTYYRDKIPLYAPIFNNVLNYYKKTK